MRAGQQESSDESRATEISDESAATNAQKWESSDKSKAIGEQK